MDFTDYKKDVPFSSDKTGFWQVVRSQAGPVANNTIDLVLSPTRDVLITGIKASTNKSGATGTMISPTDLLIRVISGVVNERFTDNVAFTFGQDVTSEFHLSFGESSPILPIEFVMLTTQSYAITASSFLTVPALESVTTEVLFRYKLL
jgi:hypothetical protein